LRKHAGDLQGNSSPQSVRLHEVDGRKKARFAKQVGPRVGNLNLELTGLAAERQVLEGRGGFGKKNEIERAVRPVGKGDLGWLEAEGTQGVQRVAIDVGRGALLHPLGDVAQLEARHRLVRVE